MSEAVESRVELARGMYGVWNIRGWEEWVDEFCAPEIVFHEAPELPDTDVFRGADALAAHLRRLIEVAGDYQFEVQSLEGRSEFVLAALEVSIEGQRSGVGATTPVFQVMRWNGKRVVELHSYFDAAQARHEYEQLSAAGT